MSVKITRKKCKSSECPIDGEQPLSNFCKSKSTKDGYNSRCKTCTRRIYSEYAAKRKAEGANEKKYEEYNGTLSTESQRRILFRVSRTLSKSFFLNDCQLSFNFGE